MIDRLYQGKWWVLLLRGIFAIILGVIALAQVRGAVMLILLWIGYYFLIDALLKFSSAWMNRKAGGDWWPDLLSALISLIVGGLVFIFPKATVAIVIALIATHAIVQGVTDIYSAVKNRMELEVGRMWLAILGGFAQLVFALWIVFYPVIGGLTLVAVIAIYAIVVGCILVVRAFVERGDGGSSGVVAKA